MPKVKSQKTATRIHWLTSGTENIVRKCC